MTQLYDAIIVEVRQALGENALISRIYIIKDKLEKLTPTKPEDGTRGFIAYDMPNKARMKMKTGKFLTRKLNLNSGFLNDESLRRIADSVNLAMYPDCDYHLVGGEDIYDNYQNRIGGSSCMTGCDADKMRMYVINSKVYRQAILSYGQDDARAMVVKLDSGCYFMDRIYSTCNFLVDKMRDIARSNGWFYRKSIEACDYGVVGCDGIDVSDFSIFTVSNLEYVEGEVPFQDTLNRYRLSGRHRITLEHVYCGASYDGVLDTTDGCVDGEGGICYRCENGFDNRDLTYSEITEEYYCDDCYQNSFMICDRCGEEVCSDDAVYMENRSEDWCFSCADLFAEKCSHCKKYIDEDYTIVEEDTIYCNTCVVDMCKKCKKCNDWFIKDGDYDLCEDCQIKEVEIREDVKALVYPGQTYFQTIY